MSDQVPLREYIERILAEHEKAHRSEHQAVARIATDAERRVEEQDEKNEIRFNLVQSELVNIRDWQSKAIGALIIISILASLIGAAIVHWITK